MKWLRKSLILFLSAIILIGLSGCKSQEQKVKDEIEPLFEILDSQNIESQNVSVIKDSFSYYVGDSEEEGFEITLDTEIPNGLKGSIVKTSKDEKNQEEIFFINNFLYTSLSGQTKTENQLFFDEFHFSNKYFQKLVLDKYSNSIETYDKTMHFHEEELSSYSKKMINQYSLSIDSEVTIIVEKLRGDSEQSFRYILTYSLYDSTKNTEVRRILVFQVKEGV
ncbi:hypothetical protein [Streptococcus loxodontisalivarius]|uniref:Lipoprotein n=1 Tax=Streptococcus loxodontisalivarius TaxID=1349415 RepID=A0ABS2PUB3_9STRE|nr:hypothetical protein [Streptococcus loxodontisalivarius]MBM7643634.1 hypothetical protein [Streptococcus loxodontisalivarius]